MLPRSFRHTALVLAVCIPASACASAFRPTEVPIPANCESLLQRAGEQGTGGFSASESQQVTFCQQQRILRAEETQAQFTQYQARSIRSAAFFSAASAIGAILAFVLR